MLSSSRAYGRKEEQNCGLFATLRENLAKAKRAPPTLAANGVVGGKKASGEQ